MSLHFSLHLPSLIALLSGILIFIKPKLLSYIVAVYLILIGILGMFSI